MCIGNETHILAFCVWKRGKIKMAVTINIYYTGKNGNAKKFAEEMVSGGVVDSIRAEKGNLRYDYFFPMEDDQTVLLIDSWENQEAIDVHHASPMMGQIASLRDKYDLTMKVERYVTDEEGVPDSDQKFIRTK
jgi:quinol monooxygenase YgiN